MSLSPHWRIELLDTSVWIYTREGLSAAAAELFVLYQYHGQSERESKFKTHVANNMVYRAIDALISRSLIGTYEAIREEIGREGPLGFDIPGLEELKAHRTYHSHPQNVTWDKKYMQDFVAKQLHYRDIKAVRLYQARQAIIDHLLKVGSQRQIPANGAIPTSAIVQMAKLCLQEAFQPGTRLPHDVDQHIINFFKEFNDYITKVAAQSSTLSNPGTEESDIK
jgi:hypothetical protein